MLTDHDNYYLTKEEPYKSCLMTLKAIVIELDDQITPEWKYKLPFFYYKQKPFCYFWKDKKTQEPYIGIVRGNEMEHPLLEAGNRTRIKIFRVNPHDDIDVKSIREILSKAMTLYR